MNCQLFLMCMSMLFCFISWKSIGQTEVRTFPKQFTCDHLEAVDFLNKKITNDRLVSLELIAKLQEEGELSKDDQTLLTRILMRYQLLPTNENGTSCLYYSYLCIEHEQLEIPEHFARQYVDKQENGIQHCYIYSKGRHEKKTISGEDCILAIQKQIREIPPSLALAQASIESGFGTSYFAKEAFNLFGLQTLFSSPEKVKNHARCVPARRKPNLCVYNFNGNIELGFYTYMQILNSRPAYSKLREARYESSENEDHCELALQMSNELAPYANEKDYPSAIQSIIRKNCNWIENCDKF